MPYQGIVGNFGVSVGNGLTSLFGLLGYLLPIMLLYPVKRYYDGLSQKSYESAIAFILLCFSILMVQALLIDGDLSGQVGFELVLTFSPFIGVAGVWIFVILALVISLLIILEEQLPTIKDNVKYGLTTGLKNMILAIFANISNRIKAKKTSKEIVTTQTSILNENFHLHTKLDEKEASPQASLSAPILNLENRTNEELLQQDLSQDDEMIEIVDDEIFEEEAKEIEEIEEIEEETEDEIKEIENEEILEEEPKSHTSIIVEELEENKKLLEDIEVGEVEKPKDFILPKCKYICQTITDD